MRPTAVSSGIAVGNFHTENQQGITQSQIIITVYGDKELYKAPSVMANRGKTSA